MSTTPDAPDTPHDGDFQFGDVDGNVNIIQGQMTAGGDIIAGNKTVIQNIIQQSTKQVVTAPYKFLASYDISDRDIFFGRDAVIDDLAGKIPRHKTLILNGRSGSGKTSLINAGLIPRLAKTGYFYLSFREYSNPLQQLREHLAHDANLKHLADQVHSLTDLLQILVKQQQQKLVMVFDQFERFFVNVPTAHRRRFLEEFHACMNSALSVEEMNIIFSLREDFFGAFVIEFEALMPHFFNESAHYNLHPLKKDEARDAIMRPLKNIPYHIGYNIQFVDDVLLPGLMGESSGEQEIDPPHLQIVCNQLYEAVRQRYAADLEMGGVVQIDRQLYHDLGETKGILHSYLDDVIDRVAHRDSDTRNVLRSILKLMIETTGTRKFVAVPQLQCSLPDVSPPKVKEYLRQLQDARVIESLGQDETARYSVSHEVMVAKVQSWFDERELQRKKATETLERGLAEWNSSQSLLNEKQVEHIGTWLGAESLADDAQQLLSKSRQAQEARQRHEVRQKKLVGWLKRGLAIVIVIAFTAAIGLTIWAFLERNNAIQQQHTAESEQKIARSRELAAYATAALETDPTLSFRLSEAAFAFAPTRQAEDALFASLEFPFYAALRGHSNSVVKAIFSADGASILTISTDGSVRTWDTATGSHKATFTGDYGELQDAIFSPDGQWVVTMYRDEHPAQFWDAATGERLRILPSEIAQARLLAFSPDERHIAALLPENSVQIWNRDTHRIQDLPVTHTSAIDHVEFSQDGSWLVTASYDKAQLWKPETGELIREFQEQNVSFSESALSPDGTCILSIDSDFIRIWDTETGQVTLLEVNSSFPPSAQFSPDGRQVVTVSLYAGLAGQTGSSVQVWDVEFGEQLYTLEGHTKPVNMAAFSPDGSQIITVSDDNTARLWDASTDDDPMMRAMFGPSREMQILKGHSAGIAHAAFSPDGQKVVTTSFDHTARLWHIQDLLEEQIFQEHTETIHHAAFSPDDRKIATAGADTRAILWNAVTGERLHTLGKHTRPVTRVVFSPDGETLLTVSKDRTARLWNTATGEQIFPVDTDGVFFADFAREGRTIITIGDTVRFWESAGGTKLREIAEDVTSAGLSPDGTQLAVVSQEQTVQVWNAVTGEFLRTLLENHPYPIYQAEYSPTANVIAAGSYFANVWLWNAATGDQREFDEHRYPVTNMVFSPDGARLVTASYHTDRGADTTTLIWDVETGQRIHDLHERTAFLAKHAFSPDGKRLVTVSLDDNVAKIWDVESGRQLYVLKGHTRALTYAAFSPDGAHILTASRDGTARIWPATIEGVFHLLREKKIRGTFREFTEEERRQYGIVE